MPKEIWYNLLLIPWCKDTKNFLINQINMVLFYEDIEFKGEFIFEIKLSEMCVFPYKTSAGFIFSVTAIPNTWTT